MIEILLKHWPFAAAALCIGCIGEVATRVLWYDDPPVKWRLLGRKTRPLHALLAGILLGLIPGMPTSYPETTANGAIIYYATAGVCSSWGYDVVRFLVRKFTGARDSRLPQPKETPS